MLRLRASDPGYVPWAMAVRRAHALVEEAIADDPSGAKFEATQDDGVTTGTTMDTFPVALLPL